MKERQVQQVMQAIIVTGGKQYNVSEGDTLFIEKLDVNAGDSVVFDQVLAIVDGENTKFGTPVVEGAKVERQGQEDPYLQVPPQEGLSQTAGPSSAVHQGRDRQDHVLRQDDHRYIPHRGIAHHRF